MPEAGRIPDPQAFPDRPRITEQCGIVLQGLADGDTIGGPLALASLVVTTVTDDPFDLDALGRAYLRYFESGSFDSGPCFEKTHQLITEGWNRHEAVREVNRLFRGATGGCNPTHRFMACAGLELPYEALDQLARRDASLTHHDPVAGLCSSVSVRIIRRCLDSESLGVAWAHVTSELNDYERRVLACEPGKGGYAPTVLVTALGFAQKGDTGLPESLDYAGPNNYCPPVVGALICATDGRPRSSLALSSAL